MKYGAAFLAGVVGGIVMTIIITIAREGFGMEMNLSMMEGTMLGLQPSLTTWIIGFLMHLMISGIIGILYAVGFEYLTHRASWLIGMGFALIHIVIAGLFFGLLPAIHPMIPEQMPAPGMFMLNKGLLFFGAFLMLHLIYGAIVGAMYATPIHEREHYDEPHPIA